MKLHEDTGSTEVAFSLIGNIFRKEDSNFWANMYSLSQTHLAASHLGPASHLLQPTGTQNHKMVGVGRDLCESSSPTLLPKQGHLQ